MATTRKDLVETLARSAKLIGYENVGCPLDAQEGDLEIKVSVTEYLDEDDTVMRVKEAHATLRKVEGQQQELQRTTQEELEGLRVSIARIAQKVGAVVPKLDPQAKPLEKLAELAKQDRGWNALCADIICQLELLIGKEFFCAWCGRIISLNREVLIAHMKGGEYVCDTCDPQPPPL